MVHQDFVQATGSIYFDNCTAHQTGPLQQFELLQPADLHKQSSARVFGKVRQIPFRFVFRGPS